MKYRKKPVVIEAMQFNGNPDDIISWIVENKPMEGNAVLLAQIRDENIIIKTLEGDMKASIGDWIIKGVNGEFYPCKPDIFEKTYEAVEEIKNEK